jgi:hypothetical protein
MIFNDNLHPKNQVIKRLWVLNKTKSVLNKIERPSFLKSTSALTQIERFVTTNLLNPRAIGAS